ncbi:MAG: serine--tRNA ligase [Clostridiales bacterium]|nr:serine--tRNA ligase [Clostridiales bacterium]
MLDIKRIKDNPEEIVRLLKYKGRDAENEINRILELDAKRRSMIQATESLKAEQNNVSKQIPILKKEKKDISDLLVRMKGISDTIKENDQLLRDVESELRDLMLDLPNLPDADLRPGGKENNEQISATGTKPEFDFEAKNHVDICTDLGIIDYPRGAKLAGSGFWVYRGLGARLEWALINYFIDTHIADGYELLFVPHMLNYDSGLTAGQFPKFEDDVFWVQEDEPGRKRFLLPTAETALVSMHRDEILDEKDLPKKYIAFTPCYRREAGSYRADERGMIRGHQFNKVEMVQYTTPEGSDEAFAELVRKAEKLVEGLGLYFRTVKLAAEDCSASMARTYDIEIYIPSMGGFKEVSSASNARDYQARRGQMRYRRQDNGKIEFVHTLNASGLATSRVLPAIAEQNQLEDGSVVIPEVLRKYMNGCEIIRKAT